MKRFLAAFVVAACAFLTFTQTADAVSPSQQECEAQGGTFERDRGEVSCTVVEEGKNPKFTETTETTGQGNIDNKQEEETECEGTGSNKCPPGQFK